VDWIFHRARRAVFIHLPGIVFDNWKSLCLAVKPSWLRSRYNWRNVALAETNNYRPMTVRGGSNYVVGKGILNRLTFQPEVARSVSVSAHRFGNTNQSSTILNLICNRNLYSRDKVGFSISNNYNSNQNKVLTGLQFCRKTVFWLKAETSSTPPCIRFCDHFCRFFSFTSATLTLIYDLT